MSLPSLNKVGEKMKQMQNKVKEKVTSATSAGNNSTTQHDTVLLNEPAQSLYRNYLFLSSFINNFTLSLRESLASIHKMCLTNRELASTFHKQVSEDKASFDIQDITEKFAFVNSAIVNSHLNDLMNEIEINLTKPLMKERETDAFVRKSIEETASTENIVQLLTTKNQERSLAVSQSILSLILAQATFFHEVSTLLTDLGELARPELEALKERTKSLQVKNSRTPQHSPQPVHPRPQPQASPQSTPKQSPKPHVAESDLLGSFASSAPAKSSKPPSSGPAEGNLLSTSFDTLPAVHSQQPPKSTVTHDLFSFDDLGTTPAAAPSMQQSSFSNDPFASFMTPSPASSPATPKNTHSADFFETFQPQVKTAQSTDKKPSNDLFESLISPKVVEHKPQAASSASPTPSNYVHPSWDNSNEGTTFDDNLVWGDSKGNKPIPKRTGPPVAVDPESIRKRQEEKINAIEQRELEKENELEAKRRLDAIVTPRVENWAGGRRGNLRSLLSTLHLVLWEDSGWKEVSLGDLVTPSKLKIAYMKALRIVHPDKAAERTIEEKLVAERVFELLNEAYHKEENK